MKAVCLFCRETTAPFLTIPFGICLNCLDAPLSELGSMVVRMPPPLLPPPAPGAADLSLPAMNDLQDEGTGRSPALDEEDLP